MATGLFLVFALDVGLAADGFAIFHDGRFQIRFHPEFAFHPFHDDLDVLVAHAADQGFLGHGVAGDDDSRVFVHQAVQGVHDLIFLALLLRPDGTGVHGQRERDRREEDRVVLVAQRIARRRKLQFRRHANVTGRDFRHGNLRLAAHGKDVGHSFLFLPAGVVDRAVGLDGAREDTNKAQPSDEGIRRGLKDQGRHGSARVADFFLARGNIGHLEVVQDGRIGVVDDGIHRTAQADILGGAAADHRENDGLPDALDQALVDFFVADCLAVQIAHHAVVVRFHRGFHHLFMHVGGVFFVLIGNLDFIGTIAVFPIGFHGDTIDNAFKVLFFAQRQFQWQHFFAELAAQVVQDAVEVRIFPVHLVDQDDARQLRFFRQFPALLRPDLDAGRRTDDDQGAVHGAESPLDFRHEIGEARRIDKVDL